MHLSILLPLYIHVYYVMFVNEKKKKAMKSGKKSSDTKILVCECSSQMH